ncbi:unnamed protein product, partial [Prorocentrum cordatum]
LTPQPPISPLSSTSMLTLRFGGKGECSLIVSVAHLPCTRASQVRAMLIYDGVAKVVEPKKQALAKAESELAEANSSLAVKKAELKEVQDKVEKLVSDFDIAKKKKADLQDQVEVCSKRLVTAEKLINGLGGEKTRWSATSATLDVQFENLTGDVLIASGIIAYLGTFLAKYRNESVGSWIDLMRANKLPASSTFLLRTVLGEEVVIRQWLIDKLPNDQVSIDNALILSKSRRWPLMIDPQLQGFRLYITTKLPNPHYSPEICVQVTLLNFMVTPDGLQDQMLGILVAKEEPEVEKKRQMLIVESAQSKSQLKEIEDKILEQRRASWGPIGRTEVGSTVVTLARGLDRPIKSQEEQLQSTFYALDPAEQEECTEVSGAELSAFLAWLVAQAPVGTSAAAAVGEARGRPGLWAEVEKAWDRLGAEEKADWVPADHRATLADARGAFAGPGGPPCRSRAGGSPPRAGTSGAPPAETPPRRRVGGLSAKTPSPPGPLSPLPSTPRRGAPEPATPPSRRRVHCKTRASWTVLQWLRGSPGG